MRFSKYFGLNQKQAELDFVDIDVSRDTRLFLDPYSIQIKENEFSSKSADQIKTYFSEVMEALRTNNLDHARYLTSHLSEPRETFLGFSKGPPRGRGVGRFQADQLLSAFRSSSAFRSGLLSDLAEAELFIDGISSDKISDLTTNVIRKSLIEYTQAECHLHGIKLERAVACAPVWDEVERDWHQGYPRGRFGSIRTTGWSDVPARLHSLVQHTHDFDESGTEGAVKDHMNGLANGCLAAFVAAVPDMKAANPGE
jgi:hypothetical protein